MNKKQLTEPPIAPAYVQQSPNDPILVGERPMQYEIGGCPRQATAKVELRFVPDDRLILRVPTSDEDALRTFFQLISLERPLRVRMSESRTEFDAIYGGWQGGELALVPTRSCINVTGAHPSIRRSLLHLLNFPDFNSTEDYLLETPDSVAHCGRITLKTDGWEIALAALPTTTQLHRALGETGGYVITHVAEIMRQDGSAYSSEQLQDLTKCLYSYLSFCIGRWAGIALPIGFDASGKRVYEQWGYMQMARGTWNASCSWFDTHHGQLLSEVFPGFYRLWSREPWKKRLHEVIYWYVNANEQRSGVGVDTRLILAQSAMEILAWVYCVQERKMVSPQAFEPRGLNAADRLRILAAGLGLPLEIPGSLSSLRAKRGKPWQDSMDAITDIRNGIVHPRGSTDLPDGALVSAWQLSLWYLDLIILRLCEHNGSYSNRTRVRHAGQLDPVPWPPAST